jgi:predicted transcriptional regulator
MKKAATPQELQVLRNVPSSTSGNTVAICELAENLRASERAVRIVLSSLYRKELIATDNAGFKDCASMCSRTQAVDQAAAKKYR